MWNSCARPNYIIPLLDPLVTLSLKIIPNHIIPLIGPLLTNKSAGAGWRKSREGILRQHFCC